LSVYAASKLAGENFVQAILEKYFLIRTCGLYGVAGCWGKGTNFVETMIKLAKKGQTIRVVNDQHVTPTSTWELAARIIEILETRAYGVYHLTNEGECTWFEFAGKIFELLGLRPELLPVSSREFGARAVRPFYSVLENKRASILGITPFSPWEEALQDYLIRKGHLSTDK
jgi:dTDP-4-dehydrorhamnose reductase